MKKDKNINKLLDKAEKAAEKAAIKATKKKAKKSKTKTQKPKSKKISQIGLGDLLEDNRNYGTNLLKQYKPPRPTSKSLKAAAVKAVQKGAERRKAMQKPEDEQKARENIKIWNRYLKAQTKAAADINRVMLERMGVVFTKTGNISLKSIKNAKAKDFFYTNKIDINELYNKLKQRNAERRKRQRELLKSTGLSNAELDNIYNSLYNRGELWYHTGNNRPDLDPTSRTAGGLAELLENNLKNKSFREAAGLDIKKPDKNVGGYDVTNIL